MTLLNSPELSCWNCWNLFIEYLQALLFKFISFEITSTSHSTLNPDTTFSQQSNFQYCYYLLISTQNDKCINCNKFHFLLARFQNKTNQGFILTYTATRWLAVRIDLLVVAVVTSTSLVALWTASDAGWYS